MSFSEWKEVALEEIVDVLGDGLHGTPKYDENGEYYFINGNNLDGNIIIDEKTKKVSYEEFLKYKKDLNERTILISINGTLGNVAFYNGEKVVLGKSACYFNVKENCSKEFIKYIMLSHAFKHYINTYSTGTTIKNMGLKQMRAFRLNLPEINEQKAIAHILSTLDDKIEVNNQINKTLENMAQTIFKQWFVDFEFPNEGGEPYKSSGGEMVESELGLIPKGWEVKTILDMGLIVTDYVANGSFKALKENVTLYEEHNYAIFMRNTDLKCNFNSGMKYVDRHSYDFLKKSRLYGGEVIISNVGDVGSVYLCPYFDQPMTLGNNVIMVKAETNPIWNYFVYRLFNSREGQGMIDSITGGSAQPKFNKTDFRNLKVVIPSEMFINNYMKTLSSIEDCILLNDKQNSELIKIRDSLLPKLMSGEIRVPMDEEGEAS